MSSRVNGIGIYRSRDSLPTPRVLPLEVVVSTRKNQLHPTIDSSLDVAVRLVDDLFPGESKLVSSELDLFSTIDTSLLEGPSFGAAIFVSLVGTALGVGTRDDVSFTGEVASDGRIQAVGDIDLKLQVASDEKLIVIPAKNELKPETMKLGPKFIASNHVTDILWLGLGSDYLFNFLLEESGEAWNTLETYLEQCASNNYLPYDLGECARRAFLANSRFTKLYSERTLQWTSRILALAPLSDPNPTNILQAVLCSLDVSSLLSDRTDLLEKNIAALFKELAQRGRATESIDLLNLYFLLRNSKEVLGSPGPIRSAALEVLEELRARGDADALECIFGGRMGLAQRIQSSGISDADLYSALKDPPLETVVIHDRRDEKVNLGRFQYRFRERQLDYENEYPMALFDSSATVPDFLQSSNWSQQMDAVFSHPEGTLMAENFSYQAFDLNRFDTRILWRDGVGCWPPSIDSLHFLSDIYNNGLHKGSETKRILDLCCGCGVIGIALSKLSKARDVRFLDSEPSAGSITRINIMENFNDSGTWMTSTDKLGIPCERASRGIDGKQLQEFTVYVGEATSVLTNMVQRSDSGQSLFDRVYFTPPYVPEPSLLGTSLWKATAGTELLEWIIQNAHAFTADLVVAYSTIAEHAVKRAINNNDRITSSNVLGEHWVALRIPGMVEQFETIPSGVRKGRLTERAEAYWNMYLHRLQTTDELHRIGLLPHKGHGFKFAHMVKSVRIRYG